MGSAEPRDDAMPQAFVQNVLENARQRRDGDQSRPVIIGGNGRAGHVASLNYAPHCQCNQSREVRSPIPRFKLRRYLKLALRHEKSLPARQISCE
jgi:hypothetical protein